MLTDSDFEKTCMPYYPQVKSLCRRMLGNGRAEDAAQETYLRAMRSYVSLRERHAARSWLLAIAARLCLDALREREFQPVQEEPGDCGPDPDARGWVEKSPGPCSWRHNAQGALCGLGRRRGERNVCRVG